MSVAFDMEVDRQAEAGIASLAPPEPTSFTPVVDALPGEEVEPRKPFRAYVDIETTTAAASLFAKRNEESPATAAEWAAWWLTNGAAGLDWIREHAADEALNPHGGRVICWGLATSDGQDLVDSDTNERALLSRLDAALVGASTVIAWRGVGFDFLFLKARALSHVEWDENDRPTPETERFARLARWFDWDKPWDKHVLDPLQGWFPHPKRDEKGWKYSLDAAAELLGIKRPTTLPGAEVPAAWYEGRIDEIRAHCLDDVRTLRQVVRRLAAGRRG